MTGPTRRRVVAAAATVLVIAVAVGIGIVVLSDEPEPPTYTAETQQTFLDACTQRGGDDVDPECRCLYDAITVAIPYERYREVSDALLADPPAEGELLDLPDDFDALLRQCRQAAPLPGS